MEFRAYRVKSDDGKHYSGSVVTLTEQDLPVHDVLIRVHYSSVNYKDALSAAGNKAVSRNFPHTPGIDAAGEIVRDKSGRFPAGLQVVVTGYDLGMNTAGGFAEFICVPPDWVQVLPTGLSMRDAMAYGTAGLTAALCVQKLQRMGLPAEGEVLVTGASGGVGSIAVNLLAKLGHDVVAVSGKSTAHAFLLNLGAKHVLSREVFMQDSAKPMLKPRWHGAVDVCGGEVLAATVKSMAYGCSVAACGLVSSPDLALNVFPFILRDVNLLGVDSVELPLVDKGHIWRRFAAEWALPQTLTSVHEITLEQLPDILPKLLKGESQGRYLVNLA